MLRAGVAAILLVGAGVEPAAAQGLADRVAGIDDGWAVFQVEVRPEVEVCDRGIRMQSDDGEGEMHWHWGRDDRESCTPGPLQVELRVAGGTVRELKARRPRPVAGSEILGEVHPDEASDFLVSLAYRDAAPDAAEKGFFLAQLPRGADATAGILQAARDRNLQAEIRRSALFWAGQLAAREVVSTLDQVAREEDEEQEVRDAAIFALSQHDSEAVVPALMELALEAPHAGSRKTAFFWLAQRDEPEVAEFLADVILGRRGG